MILNGKDVTTEIRQNEISQYASDVSAIPEVRTFLLEMQRQFARENSVIMDGRDIGTVVLPDAEVKVVLTAPLEERARRRFVELEQRDYNDSHRAAAPLRQAEEAVLLDTGELNFDESLAALLTIIRKKVGE